MKTKLFFSILTVLFLFVSLLDVNAVFLAKEEINIQTNSDEENFNRTIIDINNAIYSNGANWIADYNSIAQKDGSFEDIGLGCINEDIIDYDYESISEIRSAPNSFNWQDYNGTNWITSIKNQRSCGSCVAFGTLASLESVIQIETGQTFDCDLSESFLFYCGGGSCSVGWRVSEAANYILDNGVPDEECFPYEDTDLPCDEKSSNWRSRLVKVASSGVVPDNVDAIKAALLEYGPLVTTFDVYDDFFYYRSGVYEHVWGSYAGGHAVCIVGYNDDPGYWICKNSWGNGWGDNGFFNIKYRKCNIGKNTRYFDGISGNLPPSIPNNPKPNNNEISVETNVNLMWDGGDFDGDDVFYDVFLSKGSNVNSNNLIEEHYSGNSILVNDLEKNSKYSWFVIAEDEHGSRHKGPVWNFMTIENVPPLVMFEKPLQGQLYWNNNLIPFNFKNSIIIGEIDLIISGSDEGAGLDRIELYLNNELINTFGEDSSFNMILDKKSIGYPIFVLKAVAYDKAGNNNSDEIFLRIYNL